MCLLPAERGGCAARIDLSVEHVLAGGGASASPSRASTSSRTATSQSSNPVRSNPPPQISPLRLGASSITSPDAKREFATADDGLANAPMGASAFGSGLWGSSMDGGVSHMTSIPEDHTQREPAPLTPMHLESRHAEADGTVALAATKLPTVGEDTWGEEDGSLCGDHTSRSLDALSDELSELSNASSELWLARSRTEEDALRGARARQMAAARNAGSIDRSPTRCLLYTSPSPRDS